MTLELIHARRSIRRYTNEPVPDALVAELLDAAMSAPSAGDEQPWHFIVIRDKELLSEIPKIHPYSHMVVGAPLAILLCGDLELERHKGFWVQDCAAATENLLLAVTALNLGAVWIGVYPNEERVQAFAKLFKIPQHIIPFSLIPIGHPGEHKPPTHRHSPDRVHLNKWSSSAGQPS